MLNVGNLSISDLFLGSTKVSSAWLGKRKVWPDLPYDAEVEYLESTSTQWIDTGLILTQEHSATLEFMVLNNSAAYLTIFGARYNSAGNRAFDFWRSNNGRTVYQSFDGIGGAHSQDVSDFRQKRLTAELGLNFVLNGVPVKTFTGYSSFTTPTTAKLFGMNWTGGAGVQSTGPMRCYSLTIKKSGVTVMDLIPVRKNGIGCMYDKVTGALFENKGTGSFIIGEKPTPIRNYDAEVEYLESDGASWIDTGVFHDWSNAVRFKLRMPSSSVAWVGAYADYVGEGYPTTRTIYYNTSRTDLYVYHGSTPNKSHLRSFTNIVGADRIVEGYTSLQGYSINGRTSAANPGTAGRSYNTMKLFYSNGSYNGQYAEGSRIYYFKIDNQCDMIPVRFTNENGQSEGAMYDKVSKQLFRNKGTGSFVIGPDVTQ